MSDIQRRLQQALTAHKRHDLAEAERCYRAVLKAAPRHFDALQLLGALLLQRGQNEKAERFLREALSVNSRDLGVLNNHSVALKNMGRLPEALEAAEKVLAVAPDALATLSNRGNILRRLGRLDESLASLDRALALKPDFFDAINNRATTLAGLERLPEAVAAYTLALQLRPNHGPVLQELGNVCLRIGRRQEAIDFYKAALQSGGDRTRIEYALAALGVGERPTAAPMEYVRTLFNDFAVKFDEQLVGKLQYRTPELIGELVSQAYPSGSPDILDLGCGTGLCGPLLRPIARTIVGVDLAPNMLDKARQRSAYDELVCADIVEYLRNQQDGCFDVVIAADVFVYVGELGTVFQECRRVLRNGGRLVFSVEAMDGNGIELRASLRYAHSESYLRNLASLHRFGWEAASRSTLRLDGGVPIEGQLVMLR